MICFVVCVLARCLLTLDLGLGSFVVLFDLDVLFWFGVRRWFVGFVVYGFCFGLILCLLVWFDLFLLLFEAGICWFCVLCFLWFDGLVFRLIVCVLCFLFGCL